MRATLLLFAAALVAAPLAAQDAGADTTLFFLKKPEPPSEALKAYVQKPYRPIRPSEVRSASFLTEGQKLPFGRALGPTSPPDVDSYGASAVAERGSHFAVRPPEGGSYRAGDTLLVATRRLGPKGWGDIIEPTGLLEVTAAGPRQTVTKVIRIYGPMREGQVVFPAGPVPHAGEVRPVPTPDGPTGSVIVADEAGSLMMPSTHMFIDLGRDDGIKIGDFVAIRRRSAPRVNAPDTIEEPMATGQVVAVGGASSTIKLVEVQSPTIAPGTPAVRIATLPN